MEEVSEWIATLPRVGGGRTPILQAVRSYVKRREAKDMSDQLPTVGEIDVSNYPLFQGAYSALAADLLQAAATLRDLIHTRLEAETDKAQAHKLNETALVLGRLPQQLQRPAAYLPLVVEQLQAAYNTGVTSDVARDVADNVVEYRPRAGRNVDVNYE
jgi:hypothetical protein